MFERELSQYESLVSADFLDAEGVRCVLSLVLDHLKLDIVKEETPDYIAFELVPRGSVFSKPAPLPRKDTGGTIG